MHNKNITNSIVRRIIQASDTYWHGTTLENAQAIVGSEILRTGPKGKVFAVPAKSMPSMEFLDSVAVWIKGRERYQGKNCLNRVQNPQRIGQ